jgi:hypothetical protein
MHQYTSTHTINGRGRDVSYLFGEANAEAQSAGGGLEARVAALETALRELSWAVFSGTEDKADNDAARAANVAYRIDQRLGRASDGTTMNSVADTALAAVRAIERLSEASGMDSSQVRSIVGDELSDMMDAAKRALTR